MKASNHNFKFYHGSQHGWLAVKRQLLHDMDHSELKQMATSHARLPFSRMQRRMIIIGVSAKGYQMAKPKKSTKLTVNTLLELCQLASGYGLGLAGSDARMSHAWAHVDDPYAALRQIDEAIVNEANTRGWSKAMLLAFMDSRVGRHVGDGLISAAPSEIPRKINQGADWFIDGMGDAMPEYIRECESKIRNNDK